MQQREVKYVPHDGTISEHKKFRAENVDQKSDTFFLYFTILTGTIPLFVGGASFVWISPVLATLQSNDTELNPLEKPITVVETSMLAALPALVGLLGCLVMSKMADYLGRKNSLLISAAAMAVFHLWKAFCHRTLDLIICRCAFYICFNCYTVIFQVYIKETCEDHNRAKFICIMNTLIPLGNLYTYSIGPYLSFRDFNIYCTLPILPFLVMFMLAPESPFFLFSQEKNKECITALRKVRSNKSDKEINSDFIKIEETFKLSNGKSKATFLSLFKTKENRVGFKLLILVSLAAHCTGVAVIATFLGPLLHATRTTFSEETMIVVVGVTQVVSLLLTSFVVEKAGRKVLMIISETGCSVTLFLFGLFYYLTAIDSPIVFQIQWVPIACIIAFFLSFAVGMGSVPLTVISELFTSELITVAIAVASTVTNITVGMLNFLYPIIVDCLGIHWCMWMYSFMCFAGAGLVYKMVPETRGRSSLEIQEILRKY